MLIQTGRRRDIIPNSHAIQRETKSSFFCREPFPVIEISGSACMPYICGFNPCVWNSIFGLGKKAAGRQVLCTHRRVTPALGARLLRSYVPLRYVPSESGCVNNTCLPADTLSVRKIENQLTRTSPSHV